MINLTDEQYNDNSVKIFNGGIAGEVAGVGMKIVRKSADSHPQAPDYEIVVFNETGEVSKGIYREQKYDEWKESRLNFFVKEMKHMFSLVDVDFPKQVSSYEELLDITMKAVHENVGNKKFNVFVAYGNLGYPSEYIEIGSCFQIEPEGKSPYKGKNPLMVKPVPDDIQIGKEPIEQPSNKNSDDLFWGN